VLHACLIALFASILLSRQAAASLGQALPPLLTLSLAIALPLGWLGVLFAASWRADRHIGRTGSLRSLRTLDRLTALATLTCTFGLCAATLMGGWLTIVRSVTGDLIVVDEALAVSPLLVLTIGTWALSYPIQRRLREAVIFRQVEQGLPVHPIPTRAGFVSQQTRHQLLLLLVPMGLLWTISESLDRGVDRLVALARRAQVGEPLSTTLTLGADLGRWLATSGYGPGLLLTLHVGAALVVVACAPAIIRRLWRTTPLTRAHNATRAPSTGSDLLYDLPVEPPLSEDLLALAREQRVGVAQVLIWQTGGTTLNGAVLGVLGRFRYILLTDALLERLPRPMVLAVMAHELAHVKLRHIPWLAATLFAASSLPLIAAQGVGLLVGVRFEQLGPEFQLLSGVASVACAIAAFGFVSRRFEWQADAFAVRALSQREQARGALTVVGLLDSITGGGAPGAGTLTLSVSASSAMAGALLAVASANGTDPRRFGFRHGSIAHRVARIKALPGTALDAVPIDRAASRLKFSVAVACIASIAALVLTEI